MNSIQRWLMNLMGVSYSRKPSVEIDLARLADCPTNGSSRVLMVTHNLNLEGAPNVLYDISVGLKEHGQLEPVIYSPVDGPLREKYQNADIPIIVASLPFQETATDWWTRREYDESLRTIHEIMRNTAPDVVVANTTNGFPVVRVASQLGIPCVWSLYESYDLPDLMSQVPPLARQDFQKAFDQAAHLVFCSHGTRDCYQHLESLENTSVIHNGIDVGKIDSMIRDVSHDEARARIGASPNKKVIISVGTVCERKSQHVLVEAAARLKQTRSDFMCYLVGMREEVAPKYILKIRELIHQHNLHDVVHLVEETPRVFDYYRAADVFVLNSQVEAYCMALLEAAAFGLPIITTPCCGVSEQVTEDFNAKISPIADHQTLTQHLHELLNDDVTRLQMASNSREQFESLTTRTQMLTEYERIILEVQGATTRKLIRAA